MLRDVRVPISRLFVLLHRQTDENSFNHFRMDNLYIETNKKDEKLKKKNVKVVHILVHDFDKRCKEGAVYKSLIDSLHPNRE